MPRFIIIKAHGSSSVAVGVFKRFWTTVELTDKYTVSALLVALIHCYFLAFLCFVDHKYKIDQTHPLNSCVSQLNPSPGYFVLGK